MMSRAEITPSGIGYNLELTKEDVLTTIKIGGLTEKFVPNINANKWNDECWLNINHPDVVNAEKETFVDGKIELEVGNNIHRYYEINGKLEYEIDLKEKPPGGRIEFDLDFPDGLRFEYQRPLAERYAAHKRAIDRFHNISSLEEYIPLIHRADNAVGSYAVYWKKKNNKYKSGKFCHVYCPYIVGIDKKRIKCSQHIDPNTKKWAIIIPDGVKYPAVLDPNFGYESIGVENTGGSTGILMATARDTAPAGTVTKMHFYSANSDGALDFEVGLYNDSGGDPNNQVGDETEFANAGTWGASWHEFSPVSIIVSAVVHWQAMTISGSLDALYYDDSSAAMRYDLHSYGAGWPATFVEQDDLPYEISLYSEIPAAGGGNPWYAYAQQ